MSYVDEFTIGIEREVLANTSFGVGTSTGTSAVSSRTGECPIVAYELALTMWRPRHEPQRERPILPDAQFLGARFDDPVHTYHAVEVTLNRRVADHWSVMTSYRWSRLRGNFDGFYRDDNGQSDPGWTSLYDFPTNDPSYTAIGGPRFGYEGDIRFLGQTASCRSIGHSSSKRSGTMHGTAA